MDRTRRVIAAAGTALLLAPAWAGPDWEEPFDAGALPAGAIPVTGPAATPVAKIKGELMGAALVGGDFQDMYVIDIPIPSAFLADVDFPTAFDTEIWLFQLSGLGLLGNDEDSGDIPLSILRSVATDGSGFIIPAPGRYLLAISGHDSNPRSAAGALEIFDQVTRTEISGADGSGGSLPIDAWSGPGAFGEYEILLSGVVFIPCPGDVNQDGTVDFLDLLSLLSLWGPCAGCIEDIDGSGAVGFGDLLIVLSSWGPCPY